MSDPKIVNLSGAPVDHRGRPAKGSRVEIRDPARKLGSTHCGFRLYRLAPGMQATRLHRHLLQEEMFLILSRGAARFGTADRRVPVKAGDFILYPAGDPAAHTFVNSGAEPMEYVATGDRVAYEVCEYPEEGTVYVEAIDKTPAERGRPCRPGDEGSLVQGRPVIAATLPGGALWATPSPNGRPSPRDLGAGRSAHARRTARARSC